MKLKMEKDEFKAFWKGIEELLEQVRKAAGSGTRLTERDVREAVSDVVYSERFANFLREALLPTSRPPVEQLAAAARLYQAQGVPVVLVTAAGSVSGRIAEVGDDYVVVREPQGTTVVVNLNNTLAIYAEGSE
jgi:hypothetical protein